MKTGIVEVTNMYFFVLIYHRQIIVDLLIFKLFYCILGNVGSGILKLKVKMPSAASIFNVLFWMCDIK